MTTVQTPTKSIAAVLNYLERDEHRDWEANGQPTDHIYTHVMCVRGWLDQHDGGVRFATETDLTGKPAAADMDEFSLPENRNFAACSDSVEDRGVRDLFYALTAYCEWRGAVLPPGIREFMDGAVKVRAMPMLVAAREALEAHRVSESDIPI